MNTLKSRKRNKPFIITKPLEAILKAAHFYRFMAAEDLCHLYYSPKSITYVRNISSFLSGGDFKPAQYLYRFPLLLPNRSIGGMTRVITLGSKGRAYLANEGLPIDDWHFRPSKVKFFSYGMVLHSLLLTRTLCAAQAWAAKQPDFKLVRARICYELAREAATVEINKEGKVEKLKVTPDAWIEFERNDGKKFPILLEVDRGMEHGKKYMSHVRSRIEFIRSGAYKKCFKLMLC